MCSYTKITQNNVRNCTRQKKSVACLVLFELSDESAMHVLEAMALIDDDVTPFDVTEKRTIIHGYLVRRDEDGHGRARGCEALQLLDFFQTSANDFAFFLFFFLMKKYKNLRGTQHLLLNYD